MFTKAQSSEVVPDLAPVSDSSASSSDVCSCAQHEVGKEVIPKEVGGESFRGEPVLPSPKRVAFAEVEVRKYPMILGDHPDCRMGPPITIDWNPVKSKSVHIDTYESTRGPLRCQEELRMGWIQRKQMLRMLTDVSDKEMRDAAYEAQQTRDQRSRTVRRLSLEFIQVPVESFGRKVLRAFGRKRRSS